MLTSYSEFDVLRRKEEPSGNLRKRKSEDTR